MRRLSLLLLICSCLRAQQASIEGVAIDAVTKQPMAGVHITMLAIGSERFPTGQGDKYGAISGRDGHFSITSIAPALYLLVAQHNGFIQLPGKAPNGRADRTIAVK